MKIPEFLRVDVQTQINPEHIIAVKDYGKHMELTMSNGPYIRVNEENTDYVRSILVAKIGKDIAEIDNYKSSLPMPFKSTASGINDVGIKLCPEYNTCFSPAKNEKVCEYSPNTVLENDGKPRCFVFSEEENNAVGKVITLEDDHSGKVLCPSYDSCISYTKDPHTCRAIESTLEGIPSCYEEKPEVFKDSDCAIAIHCSSTNCDRDEMKNNIPKCFVFWNKPDNCDICDLDNHCEAKDSGTCPVNISIDKKILEPAVIEERTSGSTEADAVREDKEEELCVIYDECGNTWKEEKVCKKGGLTCYTDKKPEVNKYITLCKKFNSCKDKRKNSKDCRGDLAEIFTCFNKGN